MSDGIGKIKPNTNSTWTARATQEIKADLAQPDREGRIVYTVKKGDTLGRIVAAANQKYKHRLLPGQNLAGIAAQNGIHNPNSIRVGDTIVIFTKRYPSDEPIAVLASSHIPPGLITTATHVTAQDLPQELQITDPVAVFSRRNTGEISDSRTGSGRYQASEIGARRQGHQVASYEALIITEADRQEYGSNLALAKERKIKAESHMFEELVIQWLLQKEMGNPASTNTLRKILSKNVSAGDYAFNISPLNAASPYWLTNLALIMTTSDLNQAETNILFRILIRMLPEQDYAKIKTEINRNGITDQAKIDILSGLLQYYNKSGSTLALDPLLKGEILLNIALLTQNQQDSQEFLDAARTEFEKITGFEQSDPISARQIRAATESHDPLIWIIWQRMKYRKDDPTPNANDFNRQLGRYQANAQRQLAQIDLIQAGRESNPRIKAEKLAQAFQLIIQTHENLQGLELLAAKQLAAEVLVQLAEIVEEHPELDTRSIAANSTALASIANKPSNMLSWARTLIGQIQEWNIEYAKTVPNYENRPTWLKQIALNASFTKATTYVLEERFSNAREILQQEVILQEDLFGKEERAQAQLFCASILANHENDPAHALRITDKIIANAGLSQETRTQATFLKAEILLINQTDYATAIALVDGIIFDTSNNDKIIEDAKLLKAKILMAQASNQIQLTDQKTKLKEAETILRTTLNRPDLSPEKGAEAQRILTENLVRQAFIERELGNDYTTLITTAITELFSALEHGDQYTQNEAKLWVAKIIMLLLADKNDLAVEELISDILQAPALQDILGPVEINADGQEYDLAILDLLAEKILTPALSFFENKMLADAQLTLAENLSRQAFILKDLEQPYTHLLGAAKRLFGKARDNGNTYVEIAANIWLAKIAKVEISERIRIARDANPADLILITTEIQEIIDDYLEDMFSHTSEGFSQYYELHLTKAELLLLKQSLLKEQGQSFDYSEAQKLVVSAAQNGNRQTRAEAGLVLAGHILSIASEIKYATPLMNDLGIDPTKLSAQEAELILLENAWALLSNASEFANFSGGQHTQFLKLVIETGSRMALAYRNLGYKNDWEDMRDFVLGLESTLFSQDPDLQVIACYWSANLRFTSNQDFDKIRVKIDEAKKILVDNKERFEEIHGKSAYKRRLREVYLMYAKVLSSSRDVGSAPNYLLLAEGQLPPEGERTDTDKIFLAEVLVERAALLLRQKQYATAQTEIGKAKTVFRSILSQSSQLQILEWRASILYADAQWMGSRNSRDYEAARITYEDVISEIMDSNNITRAQDAPTEILKILLASANRGLQQVLQLSGRSRDLGASRRAGRIAQELTDYTIDQTPVVSFESGRRYYQDRITDPRRNETKIPGIFMQDFVRLEGTVLDADQWQINIGAEGTRTHGETMNDGTHDVPQASVGASIDYAGIARLEYWQRVTETTPPAESYFKSPFGQLNLRLDADPLTHGYVPLEVDISLNFENRSVPYGYGRIGFTPSRYFPALRLRGWEFSVGAKAWIDKQTAYDETAFTLDVSKQTSFNGWDLGVGVGTDLPMHWLDRYDRPDLRLHLRLDTPRTPAGTFFIDLSGELAWKGIPINYLDAERTGENEITYTNTDWYNMNHLGMSGTLSFGWEF